LGLFIVAFAGLFMFDILNEFQNAALVFSPMMLVAPSVLGVIIGIIFWLAGVKYTRIIAITAGFIGGGIAAFYWFPAHNQVPAAIIGALAGGLVAMFVHKFIVVAAGMAVFMIVVITFLIGTHFNDQVSGVVYQPAAATSVKLSLVQTIEQIKSRLTNVSERLYRLSIRLPSVTWSAFAAAILAVVVAAIFFGRFIMAFACSSLGTAMIFAGMLSLLLYKGSSPLTYVYGRISYFFLVFAAMTVAGTVVQFILCKPSKLKILKEQEEIDKKNTNRGERKWTTPQS
jgi:hypothetical protein